MYTIKTFYKKSCLVLLLLFFTLVLIAQPTQAFKYDFAVDGTLAEASESDLSWSPYWWVNSGGYMVLADGRGHTVIGALPEDNYWRQLYDSTNPLDTADGYLPQNIFRMLTKQQWQDVHSEAYFKIDKYNAIDSPNRAEHNGILLFDRYVDSDNLYYAGVRVDGAAVIKKKQYGQYTTLAYIPEVFEGVYDRDTNPNLLPLDAWIGLQTVVKDNPDGIVNIKLYMDLSWKDQWVLLADVNDTSDPIKHSGSTGIRTDFMDVTFDRFLVYTAP